MAGYELRPVAIDRPAGRSPSAFVAAAAVVAAMLVMKPWTVIAGFEAPGPIEARAPAAAGPPPATVVGSPGAASEAPSTLGSLATHSGTWGVGASGTGPHHEAEPWAEWTAVTPTPASLTAGAAPASPSRGLCDAGPTLPADPLFIAVSHETDVPIDRRVEAWWWDDDSAMPLDGAIHQVTPTGDRGIAYVIRNDRAAWPAGRYAFRLIAGDRAVGLAVCLVAAH
jgi:hypothetical protein